MGKREKGPGDCKRSRKEGPRPPASCPTGVITSYPPQQRSKRSKEGPGDGSCLEVDKEMSRPLL